MLFLDWLRHSQKKTAPARGPRPLGFESLEDRVVPRTTVYIDFGQALTAPHASGLTIVWQNIDAPATPGSTDSGPNFAVTNASGVPILGILPGDTITAQALTVPLDYDGNG